MSQKFYKLGKNFFTITYIILLLLVSTVPLALSFGDVTPDEVSVTLNPGESHTVEKTVTNPPIPPKLDFLLLEDESGSFADDIELMQGELPDYSDGLAAQIWDGLDAEGIEFRGAVAGFIDFAQDGWGGSWIYGNDWVYTLYQDMTSDKATWLSGIGALKTNNGVDYPEAQLAALMSAAKGAAWDSDGNGYLTDPEDTGPGEDPSWSDDSTKIIILVTDATCHVSGDAGGWPGPTYAATKDALNDEGIHVVILSTMTSPYTSLATDTGGAVKEIEDDSSDIVDALMAALEDVLTDVWYEVASPPKIDVSMDPVKIQGVPGGSVLYFTETITVASDAEPGVYTCIVTFYANTWPHEGAEIGTETITVEVNAPPDCENAYADPDLLWPPNHKWVEVRIMGVSDPDGDPVTITVTGVWPDEPTEGLGDGDHSPDAIIYTDYVEVRRERSGIEDGRVYHIYYTADDGRGGICECEVTVGVPHDKKDTP
jgi:hypothetical protein